MAPLSTSIDRITADSVSTPSTERSIEPIRMMKVAPRPSTSGIIAAWVMRTKLPKVRKFGLIAAMMAQSRTSTTTGAHEARRQRRRCFRGAPAAGVAASAAWRVMTVARFFQGFGASTGDGGPPTRRCGVRVTEGRPVSRPLNPLDQLYWICPLTRPQMSFQSSFGSALMLLS